MRSIFCSIGGVNSSQSNTLFLQPLKKKRHTETCASIKKVRYALQAIEPQAVQDEGRLNWWGRGCERLGYTSHLAIYFKLEVQLDVYL